MSIGVRGVTVAIVAVCGVLLFSSKVDAYSVDDFVIRVDTRKGSDATQNSFSVFSNISEDRFEVDCDNDEIIDSASVDYRHTCEYETPGEYTIAVKGDIRHFAIQSYDAAKLLEVVQWGTARWESMASMFMGAVNMKLTATDAPNLQNVTSMSDMFGFARSFNQSINHWDTSNVTDMKQMFSGARSFNQPLSEWDVGNVTFMDNMFSGAPAFNQPLGAWDVGNVVDFTSMFRNAVAFNQPLHTWDVSNATTMNAMFYQARSFNQPLGTWDVSNVTNVQLMLSGAGLSAENYTMTLAGWASRTVQPDLTLGAHLMSYCDDEARSALTSAPNSWAMIGDYSCDTEPPVVGVTSVSFTNDDGRSIMTISGGNFYVAGGLGISEDIMGDKRNIISVNGVQYKFCAENTGMTAAEMEAEFGISVASDTAPCYFFATSAGDFAFSDSEFKVWLPDGFDTTAPGTVTVTSTPTFAFNASTQPTDPPVSNDTATATAAGVPLRGNPTLAMRPTFTGTAVAGSEVRVYGQAKTPTGGATEVLLCEATAQATGNWTCTPSIDLPAGVVELRFEFTINGNTIVDGPYTVTVAQTPGGGVNVSDSNERIPGVPNTAFERLVKQAWMWPVVGAFAVLGVICTWVIVRRRSTDS